MKLLLVFFLKHPVFIYTIYHMPNINSDLLNCNCGLFPSAAANGTRRRCEFFCFDSTIAVQWHPRVRSPIRVWHGYGVCHAWQLRFTVARAPSLDEYNNTEFGAAYCVDVGTPRHLFKLTDWSQITTRSSEQLTASM